MVTSGQVILAGEVKSNAYLDVQKITRDTIRKIGYTKSEYKFDAESCGVLSAIHEQSADINQGVDRENPEDQGAGDQGMMFGYACRETDNYMPLPLDLSHRLLSELAVIRKAGVEMTYLRPDAKSQVTIQYSDEGVPERIEAIVVSTQHDDGFEATDELILAKIKQDVADILIPRVVAQMSSRVQALFTGDHKLHVNPTGKFVIGGPHGDSGLTGRKIIVDTYGGYAPHGGGAFSGKDCTKVDRSAAYMTRYLAKNIVASGKADNCTVQLSYAIGVKEPTSVYVYADGQVRADIAEWLTNNVDLTPKGIIDRFNLFQLDLTRTTIYGHFGKLDLPWEQLDLYGPN
jgi:S-adenosylmethionine synthetase